MNFYKHHLGDYDGATAHLSWDEDMAYTRLMRAYYRRERGFLDVAEACRLTRATSKTQRLAVETVLAEFFTLGDGGWRNKRCDAEIAAYQSQAAHNRVVGNLGGRPKKTTVVSENNPSGSFSKPNDNPNQEPLTKNQEPVQGLERTARATRLPPTWTLPQEWADWAMTEKPGLSASALQGVADKFRDHWLAQPGQRGVKQDWPATWRNWVRSDYSINGGKNGHGAVRTERDTERAAARRAILQPASPAERDVTRDSERVD